MRAYWDENQHRKTGGRETHWNFVWSPRGVPEVLSHPDSALSAVSGAATGTRTALNATRVRGRRPARVSGSSSLIMEQFKVPRAPARAPAVPAHSPVRERSSPLPSSPPKGSQLALQLASPSSRPRGACKAPCSPAALPDPSSCTAARDCATRATPPCRVAEAASVNRLRPRGPPPPAPRRGGCSCPSEPMQSVARAAYSGTVLRHFPPFCPFRL